jgi:hypothetical protein
VSNSRSLWETYQTSKQFGVRPSELLGILASGDLFAAYCFDSACCEFGKAVEAALHDVDGKNKKEIEHKMERVLRKWLDMPAQYRDPVKSGAAIPASKREEV